MKYRILIVLYCLLLIGNQALAMGEKHNIVESKKNMTDNKKFVFQKEMFVSLATSKIKGQGYKYFDPKKFPIVKVYENDSDIRIVFDRQIYFVPSNSAYLYSATVVFTKNAVKHDDFSMSPFTLSIDDKQNYKGEDHLEVETRELEIFEFTPKLQKKFDFVIEAINTSDKVGNLNINSLPQDFQMTIKEFKDYYQVDIECQYYSYYKIKKGSGEIYDDGHKHYEPEAKELKERKWAIVDYKEFARQVQEIKEGMREENVLEMIGKPYKVLKGNVWQYLYPLDGSPRPRTHTISGALITITAGIVKKVDITFVDSAGPFPHRPLK